MSTQIDTNRQDFERKVAEIRGYADLTDEAKRRRIADAYEEAAGRHRELVAERDRKAAERLDRLERGVMGIRYSLHATDGDRELARMSYRDAYDRAERAASEAVREGDPEKLEGSWGGPRGAGTSTWPMPSTTSPRSGACGAWPTPTSRSAQPSASGGRSTRRRKGRPRRPRTPLTGSWSAGTTAP